MSPFAYDVTLDDFDAKVIQPSLEVPVLVDFWAPWCAPCQTLMPLLAKLADDYGGKFLVAKINADDDPQIAQHFGVRSIPTVKAVWQGRVVDEFTGLLPESEIRAFIDRLLPPAPPSERDEAAALVAEGRLEEALAVLVEATNRKPDDEALRLDAVDLLMELGRPAETQELLALDYVKEADRAAALRARAALSAAGQVDTTALEARLLAHPDDHSARLELSTALAAQGQYREALEAALEVVRRDRAFADGAARQAILGIFTALGGNERYDDLVREYRRALSAALN